MISEFETEAKTIRIGIFSLTMLILGIVFSCSKTGACDSCAKSQCHDEFLEFVNGSYGQHTCDVGATAEVITSPPAPKPGILCHCHALDKSDAGPPSKPEAAK